MRINQMNRNGEIFRNILILTVAILVLTSCKNEFEEYEGSWSGVYSGDDTGSWFVNIDDQGDVSGSYSSDSLSSFTITLSGEISEDGDLSARSNLEFVDIVFSGKLRSNRAEGTWRNQSDSLVGDWTGAKD